MKVLYILNSNVMGGATISFLNLLLNQDRHEITPIVVLPTNREKTELEEIFETNDIEYHKTFLVSSAIKRYRIKNTLAWVAKYIYLPIIKSKSYSELEKLILTIKPDIIHTNTGVIHEGFHIARKHGIPHIWHLREYQTKDFNVNIFPSYRRFCSYLQHSYVITITKAIYHYFKLENNKHAFPIYNGIFRASDCIEPKTKEDFFLMASRISPEKGHVDVIKAFSNFSKKNTFKIKIVGFSNDQSYLDYLNKVINDYNCAERVDFIDFQKDIKPLMSRAKALIVASYNEGFGRMTAEAAFCSTLVIGRDSAGTKEILSKTGGLSFNTIEEMTTQMEYVSSMSETSYNKMALNAQKVAVDSYSIENNVKSIVQLYKSILK